MHYGYAVDHEVRRSLRLVIWGICFGMVFFTITAGSPLTGFARELGAGDFVYGVLMALPVVGGVMQLVASYVLETTRKRKKFFLIGGFIQRLMWIPVALVPCFVPMEHTMLRVWSVILFITISSMSGAFCNVGFFSWMGDLVPAEIRGRYFSRRSMISTISSAATGFGMGWFLDTFKGFTGYTAIFIIAALVGVLDIVCFFWVKDPEMKVEEERVAFLPMFKKAFRDPSYSRLVLFWTIWNFSINISGPFFNVYMLEHLKMSFLQISLFGQVTANIVTILVISKWGVFIDRYGNKPVLYLTASTATILPFLWCLSAPGVFYIVPIINLISGAVWCGIDLTSQNLLIGLAPEKNRSVYIAIFFMVTTIFGGALAFVTGGFFLEQMKGVADAWNIIFLGHRLTHYHYLFILSGFLRILAISLFASGIREKTASSVRSLLGGIFSQTGNKLTGRVS